MRPLASVSNGSKIAWSWISTRSGIPAASLCLKGGLQAPPKAAPILSHDPSRGGSHRLLDVGTGSGILAIGAALLGFRKVVGIDNDPEAIEVAEENIVLNGLSGKIKVFRAIPEEVKGSFDVVISNIQSMPLIRMSETIASKLSDDGRLALSGILVEQADEVCAEYEKRGLRLTGTKTAGEWVLLAFTK